MKKRLGSRFYPYNPHPSFLILSEKWRSVFELAVISSLEAAGLAEVSPSVPAVSALVSVS
jgi:hypothetical protein